MQHKKGSPVVQRQAQQKIHDFYCQPLTSSAMMVIEMMNELYHILMIDAAKVSKYPDFINKNWYFCC